MYDWRNRKFQNAQRDTDNEIGHNPCYFERFSLRSPSLQVPGHEREFKETIGQDSCQNTARLQRGKHVS